MEFSRLTAALAQIAPRSKLKLFGTAELKTLAQEPKSQKPETIGFGSASGPSVPDPAQMSGGGRQTGQLVHHVTNRYFPPLLVGLAGWGVLLTSVHRLILPGFCSAVVGSWLTHYAHGMIATLTINPTGGLIFLWGAMGLATIPPVLSEQIASLRNPGTAAALRLLAISLFAFGYGAIWLVAGAALVAVAVALSMVTDAFAVQTIIPAIIIAIAWQFTPAKQRFLSRCYSRFRPAHSGGGANAECLHYGLTTAICCIGAWWAMLLVALVAENIFVPAMAAVAILVVYERLQPA